MSKITKNRQINVKNLHKSQKIVKNHQKTLKICTTRQKSTKNNQKASKIIKSMQQSQKKHQTSLKIRKNHKKTSKISKMLWGLQTKTRNDFPELSQRLSFKGVCLELTSSWPPARVKRGCKEHSKSHFNLHSGFQGWVPGDPGMNSGKSFFVGNLQTIGPLGRNWRSSWPGIGGPVVPELV